jgi:5-methyltetrahydropteroyltriglutamate--homocysteine methyltransferase
MKRSTDRILATHTGKLFMPAAGNQAMGPPPTPPERVEYEVSELVKKQVEIGMDVISNGEPAGIGPGTVFQLVEGFETITPNIPAGEPPVSLERVRWLGRDFFRYEDFYADMFATMMGTADNPVMSMRTVVSGPLKLRSIEPFERDIQLFKKALAAHAPGKEAFYCVIAPEWLEEFVWNEYYKSDDDFVVALTEVMAPIFKTVTDNGLILQIDDPAISHDWEEARRPPMSDAEYERFIMLRIDALNAALAGIPEDMIRFHVCWGSWPGMHTGEVPLRQLAEMMLRVRAQAFSIESAKSTHRLEWQVWRDELTWPHDKIIIPGVVDHTTPVVEPPEVVADTIVNFASVCGRENVIAGTDCGMRWHAQAAWAKYENIVKGAELASRQLWKQGP